MDHNWALWTLSVLIIRHLNKKVEKWSMNSGINVTTSHWLWVLIVNPLPLLYCRLKDGLSRSIIVFLQFACDPHASSREERGVLVTCVLSLRVFFQTYACCMDTFLYFHTRTWETFWLLGTWSEEHWVSLVSEPLCLGHSLYIQYQHVQQGPF